jgi:homoserine kinase type II
MSVYTSVEREELETFLANYSLGDLVDYKGITAGIENTNYFVTTTQGEYVLTLFEALGADELPYFLDLMAFLAEHEVPSAHPLPDCDGKYLRELKDKPAAIVYRLRGKEVREPNLQQVTTLGSALGHMHTVGMEFTGSRENRRGPHWWKETIDKLHSHLDEEDDRVLHQELQFQAQFRRSDLPRGVTHADLFRDNALWDGDKLSGIIDFYYACNDVLLYDVAVTVNDWCTLPDGSLDQERTLAFIAAYNQERPLKPQEQDAWPVMLRAGALRFWLSRLHDLHFPRPGEITHTHDPDVFRKIMLNRIENHENLRQYWI